jgi:hypothetical protein
MLPDAQPYQSHIAGTGVVGGLTHFSVAVHGTERHTCENGNDFVLACCPQWVTFHTHIHLCSTASCYMQSTIGHYVCSAACVHAAAERELLTSFLVRCLRKPLGSPARCSRTCCMLWQCTCERMWRCGWTGPLRQGVSRMDELRLLDTMKFCRCWQV